jgi:hypothetical protein
MREVGEKIDITKITQFLLAKCDARGIQPTKSSYNDVVRKLAMENYEVEIRAQATTFIPFDEAWAEVLSLVSRLGIPD